MESDDEGEADIWFVGCDKGQKKPGSYPGFYMIHLKKISSLFYFIDDCFERFRLIHGQIGQYFPVDFNGIFLQQPHKL